MAFRRRRSAELRGHGMLISMSGKGNCYDNASVETFFSALTRKRIRRGSFHSLVDL
jgi:putative transposase